MQLNCSLLRSSVLQKENEQKEMNVWKERIIPFRAVISVHCVGCTMIHQTRFHSTAKEEEKRCPLSAS